MGHSPNACWSVNTRFDRTDAHEVIKKLGSGKFQRCQTLPNLWPRTYQAAPVNGHVLRLRLKRSWNRSIANVRYRGECIWHFNRKSLQSTCYAEVGSLRLALAISEENAASLNGHGSGGRFAVNEDGGDAVNSLAMASISSSGAPSRLSKSA